MSRTAPSAQPASYGRPAILAPAAVAQPAQAHHRPVMPPSSPLSIRSARAPWPPTPATRSRCRDSTQSTSAPVSSPPYGSYFARYGGLPQTAKALHRLTPAAADAVTWRHLLDVADQMMSNAQHQIAAARARNVIAFIQTVRTANRLAAQINAAGARFGFTPNSSCSQVFG